MAKKERKTKKGSTSKKGKSAAPAPEEQQSQTMAEQEQQVVDAGGSLESAFDPATQIVTHTTEQELVRNGQFAAEFVRPRFEKNKHGHLIGFDLSFNLAPGHKGFIPKQILPRYKAVLGGGVPRIDMSDIKPQVIKIALFPEDGRPAGSEILLNGCLISRARVQEIVAKGNGKEERNVRFSFTAYVEQNKEAVNFAAWKHDSLVWISMEDHQGELSFMNEQEDQAA